MQTGPESIMHFHQDISFFEK